MGLCLLDFPPFLCNPIPSAAVPVSWRCPRSIACSGRVSFSLSGALCLLEAVDFCLSFLLLQPSSHLARTVVLEMHHRRLVVGLRRSWRS